MATFDLIDRDKIVRTRDPAKLAECEYVCDVGGIYDPKAKLFDHHQKEYVQGLSSAGMILRYLLDQNLLDEEAYDFLNQSLVIGVDAHDNGKTLHEAGVCTLSHILSNFLPIEYDAPDEAREEAFFRAFDFIALYLKRLLKRREYNQSCRQEVAAAMEGADHCLFFDRKLPWVENFFALGGESHPASFVIMPAAEHWKLRGIPPSLKDRMSVRIPLPEEWAGLLAEELQQASGIPGAIFCHKGRFVSVWETRDDAQKALELTLQKGGGG